MPRAEPAITTDIKREVLGQPLDIVQLIAATLEHFQLVGEAFDKAAGLVVNEVVGDSVKQGIEQFKESREVGQAAVFQPLAAECAHPSRTCRGQGEGELSRRVLRSAGQPSRGQESDYGGRPQTVGDCLHAADYARAVPGTRAELSRCSSERLTS